MTPVTLLSISSTISPTSYKCSEIYLSLNVILSNSSFVEAVINGLNLNALSASNEAANIIPFLTFLNKSCAFFELAKPDGSPFLKLAKSFANLVQEKGVCPSLFIQVNTGEEPQKAGVLPKELDAFVKECEAMDLPIEGLMCIPPFNEDSTKFFQKMSELNEKINQKELSMGMSSDYMKAVEYKSTFLRIGSNIFGQRG